MRMSMTHRDWTIQSLGLLHLLASVVSFVGHNCRQFNNPLPPQWADQVRHHLYSFQVKICLIPTRKHTGSNMYAMQLALCVKMTDALLRCQENKREVFEDLYRLQDDPYKFMCVFPKLYTITQPCQQGDKKDWCLEPQNIAIKHISGKAKFQLKAL